jgi:hypothetical protein
MSRSDQIDEFTKQINYHLKNETDSVLAVKVEKY